MESLKEKLWRWPKKIKEHQKATNKELYPVFQEIEDFKKRAKEIKQEFDKIWYRKWENFILREWIVKTDEEWNLYINFMWNRYRIKWFRWKLYEIGKDDNWEWYIYIWWTDPYNYIKWAWDSFILRSNWFIYNWTHRIWWWNWVRFSPNWMIYSWDISRWEPLNPEEENWTIFSKQWSYYEPNWKKTTYKVMSPFSEDFNNIQEQVNEKKTIHGTENIIETTVEEIWKAIEHTLASWNTNIQFDEDEQDYVFKTHKWKELRIPLEKWKEFIASLADFINRAFSLSKKEWFIRFKSNEKDLIVSERYKPWNTKILKDVKEKLWIDANDFVERLNNYCYEERYKKYDDSKEKRWRPNKI